MNRIKQNAFTLIELLVVISIIGMLLIILVPALAKTKSAGRALVCKTNLKSLAIANIGYASENNGYMCLAAKDIYTDNLQRWHGARSSKDEPFDPKFSPLIDYIGGGKLKECPEKVKFRHGNTWDYDFENGCGGYGYNMTYLGSRIWQQGYTSSDKATRMTEIRTASETLMFSDTAMSKKDESGNPYYLEYSFAEAPFFVQNETIQKSWGYASPSIHFRHNEQANIAWADGHVGSEKKLNFNEQNAYGVNSSDMMLGWFKVLDNEYFDLK